MFSLFPRTTFIDFITQILGQLLLGVKVSSGKHGSLFVCVEVLRPSQPNGVMSSMVSLPNHTFTGQA